MARPLGMGAAAGIDEVRGGAGEGPAPGGAKVPGPDVVAQEGVDAEMGSAVVGEEDADAGEHGGGGGQGQGAITAREARGGELARPGRPGGGKLWVYD